MRRCVLGLIVGSLAMAAVPASGSFDSESREPSAPFEVYGMERGSDSMAAGHDPLAFPSKAAAPAPPMSTAGPARPNAFASSFAMISGFEVSLLVGTMMMPKSFTGWEDDFFQDGMGNLGEAWTRPPVWDTDHWFHNYVGHPYGGNVYYNALRSRGGSISQSFLFSATMSTWWEYALEAVAERPSIQDLVVTPVAGSILGEFTHRIALRMKRNGTNLAEKVALAVLNPTHVIFRGYR